MAQVSVTNADLGGLSGDMARIPPRMVKAGNKVVSRNVKYGLATAKRIAQSKSGPHGLNAHKRLDSEMTGALSGEFGWTGNADQIVGAGFRHGAANTDLPTAADIVGPKFAKDVGNMVDGLFW